MTDELWAAVEPLLPKERKPSKKGGRPRVSNRPRPPVFSSCFARGHHGSTCRWRCAAGADRPVGGASSSGPIAACGDGSTGCYSSSWRGRTRSAGAASPSIVRASRRKGGDTIGPNPPDKGKEGSKRHLVVDAQGIPLAFRLSGANVNDCQLFEELLDAIPALKRRGRGRPRRRPDKAHADKAYDHRKCRRACRQRGIQSRIARRGIESKTHLGRHRWAIERTFAWLNRQRHL